MTDDRSVKELLADNRTSKDEERFSDPMEVLKILQDAILNRKVDPALVKRAVDQTISQYESRMRLFLVGAAQARIPRIIRRMEFLDSVEDQMLTPVRLEKASTGELIRMYSALRSGVSDDIDYVKNIADMRAELEALQRAGTINVSIEGSSDLPDLDNRSRDRIRRLIDGILALPTPEDLDED